MVLEARRWRHEFLPSLVVVRAMVLLMYFDSWGEESVGEFGKVLCPGRKLVLTRLPLGITVETPNLRPGASSLSISRIKASKQRVFLTFQAIQLTVREGLRDSRR